MCNIPRPRLDRIAAMAAVLAESGLTGVQLHVLSACALLPGITLAEINRTSNAELSSNTLVPLLERELISRGTPHKRNRTRATKATPGFYLATKGEAILLILEWRMIGKRKSRKPTLATHA